MVAYHFPAQPTPFIGRTEELSQIAALLADESCRLLTLAGPGGIGKTRLAIEAALAQAGCYADGVYFVGMQPLTSTEHILPAIAQALDVQFSPNFEPKQQLLERLRDRAMLLVLDNIEHVLDGIDLLSDLLTVAPRLRIVTTSRERLNLVEEWVFEVDGLDVPNDAPVADARRYSAVELFERGAQRVDRGFSVANEWEHVVRICRLVDGMPLALELASAWVRALPAAEIAAELERSLDILETAARNVLPRHRNMRAVLDYSWTLLADDEQQTFARLAVFRGGFTRDAAEAVAGASRHMLAGLVDKSWLRYSSENGRYDIHELLRQFAQERLEASAGEARQTHERHGRFYLQCLRGIWPRMAGAQFAEASAEIETELENIRGAWVWAVYQNQFDALEGTLQSLWFFYDRGSRYQEGELVFGKASARLAESGADPALYGNVLARQAAMRFSLDRYADARPLLLHSIDILRPLGESEALAFALLVLGMTLLEEETDVAQAGRLFRESLAIYRHLNDLWGVAYVLNWLSISCILQAEAPDGDMNQHLRLADEYAQEGLEIFQELNNAWGIAVLTSGISMLAYDQGDFERAWQLGSDSLDIFTRIGVHWGRANAYHTMSDTAYRLGRYAQARQHIADGLRVASSYRLVKYALFLIYTLAEIELACGDEAWAYELLAFVNQQRQRYSSPRYAAFDYGDALEVASSGPLRAAVERGRGHVLEPFIRAVVARLSAPETASAPPPVAGLLDPLTERELDVLRLLAEGRSNRQIAETLFIALGTVKTHIHNICGKLDAENRSQAVSRARELGLF